MDLKVSAKEGLEQIKKLLFGDESAPIAPVAPAASAVALELVEYKLVDGTTVKIDNLGEGGKVMVADLPAPDGDHTLEDGTIISTLGGLITAIKTKEVEPLEAQKDYMLKSDFENFKTEILSKFSAQTKVQAEANKKTIDVLDTILKFEVEAPIKKVVDFDSLTPLQKFRAQKNA